MKNKQEVYGLITNIFLVVLLFCFIVAGLNIIGIYSLPEPIEKLLGTNKDDPEVGFENDETIYTEGSFDENSFGFEPVILDYNNAFYILQNLTPRRSYIHKLNVINRYGDKVRTESVDVQNDGDNKSVSVYDENKALSKSLIYDDETVTFTEFYGDESSNIVVPKGSFNIYEECGYILSADDFLNSGFELGSADFSRYEIDGSVFISISFNESRFGISQSMKYVISLDYGVVTEAYCSENGVMVYEMNTESISTNE